MKRYLLVLLSLIGLETVSSAMLRDSLGMRLVTQTLLGPSRQVVVQGNYAYVGVSCGLLILDVSDPAQPVEMGRAYDVNFTIIEDLFVQNGYAYLVDAYNGLAIVDVRDMRNPRMVGRVKCGYHMFGVSVKDTLAYVVGSGGLQDSSDFFVINVRVPTAPFVVAGYDTCWGQKVQVVDTLAYVTGSSWNNGLGIFDVRSPLAVRKIGQLSDLGIVYGIRISDTLAYLASSDSGLCVVNIKDPQSPRKVVCHRPSGQYVFPWGIDVQGNSAFLCEDYVAYEGYPYGNLSHLWVVDISDPTNPIELGRCETAGSGGGVFAWDSLVYFADGSKGLRVIDVRNPSQPREITHYPTGDACWELVKQGNYLYVAHGGDGLRVLDVSNPAQPVEVGHLELPRWTFDIFLKDSLLYTAEGDSGLVVVDIRNPSQPAVIGRWAGPPNGVAYGIFVQDSLVYLSGWLGPNLWIINASDPRYPYYLGAWATADSRAYDLWVRGNYAYMVGLFNSGSQSFFVVDVSDPRDPYDVYQWAWPEPGKEVEGKDSLLYTIGDPVVEVITVANPIRPDTAGGYTRRPIEDDGYGLHYFDPGYLWAGWRTYYWQTVEHCGRMDLVDVRNPHPAQSIRHYETGWTISDVWGEDFKVAYGGAYLGNLLVFAVDSIISGVNRESAVPLRISVPELTVSPNPVKGSCVIRYWSGTGSKVRLTLYDLTGRVVRSFTSFVSRLPSHEFVWDGKDGSGKEVRSGVYFLRAEFRERDITKKVIVVR